MRRRRSVAFPFLPQARWIPGGAEKGARPRPKSRFAVSRCTRSGPTIWAGGSNGCISDWSVRSSYRHASCVEHDRESDTSRRVVLPSFSHVQQPQRNYVQVSLVGAGKSGARSRRQAPSPVGHRCDQLHSWRLGRYRTNSRGYMNAVGQTYTPLPTGRMTVQSVAAEDPHPAWPQRRDETRSFTRLRHAARSECLRHQRRRAPVPSRCTRDHELDLIDANATRPMELLAPDEPPAAIVRIGSTETEPRSSPWLERCRLPPEPGAA